MLADYKVGRCSRRCYAENRPLEPGETFYSVVLPDDEGELQRRDYSARAWSEPPEGALGWWKGRIPEAGKQKLVLAPNPVLVDILRQLAASQERAELAYLLALLLMRRRVVRPVDDAESPALGAPAEEPAEAEPGEQDPQPQAVLTVEVLSGGEQIQVLECEIQAGDAVRLREELNELLYCEAE
ncbi:hypothetical protein UC8_07390 [Roseimaritima ulvae]|uniref:Uncharacterized protein n=1 Tax=Roseimaritima ulvae TaxID=980254 RepID=A0A5B9QXU2_9BACT|nr:hypothetical protein UC8_07390 [Roseimaritima ulvae]